jgi:hypothetical protein
MTARSTHLVLVPGLARTEDLFAEQIASMRGEVIISVADHARHDTMSAIARAVLATAPKRFALCGLSNRVLFRPPFRVQFRPLQGAGLGLST